MKPIKVTPKLKKEIARRAKIWKAASPSKRRVLIAKDALQQLDSKKVKAAHMTFGIDPYDERKS